MRIAHFYARTPNLGDQGAARGIQLLFRKVRNNVRFKEFGIDDKPLGYFDVKSLNDKFNGLVLGGGGLLYNLPKKASGFYFNMNYRNYSSLTIPTCFFGIGLNAEYTPNARWIMDKKAIASIKKFCDKTKSVGVRDNESVEFLQSIGVEKAALTPCPSMFLLKDVEIPKRESAAINLTHRGGTFETLEQILIEAKSFFGKLGLKLNLTVHHQDEDRLLFPLAEKHNIPLFIPNSPENLMEHYKAQRFVVGMRGHALIFATGAKVPMLALSYNKKCEYHMNLLGMENFIVKQDEFSNSGLISAKLDNLIRESEKLTLELGKKKEEFYRSNIKFITDWFETFS